MRVSIEFARARVLQASGAAAQALTEGGVVLQACEAVAGEGELGLAAGFLTREPLVSTSRMAVRSLLFRSFALECRQESPACRCRPRSDAIWRRR
jgi:hypothetical protein